MSKIIKVFVDDLPENCVECPLTHDTDFGNIESVMDCPIDEYSKTRPEDCPLIEDCPFRTWRVSIASL